MMCGPDVHIRHSEAHRHKLQEEVDRVQYQRFHAGLYDLLRQVLERCLQQPGYHLSTRILHNLETVQLRNPTHGVRDGSLRKLTLTERYKLQVGGPDRRFRFRKTEKDHLVSSCLYFACECSHRIEVPGHGQTYE